MNSIQARLAIFLAEYNLSMQAFERKCNIGVATASKLSENSRATTFAKISKAYPQLNINWLKTGSGKMLNNKSEISFRDYKPNDGASTLDGDAIYSPCREQMKEVFNELDKQRKWFEQQIIDAKSRNNEQIETYKNMLNEQREYFGRQIEKKDAQIQRLFDSIVNLSSK